MDTYEEYHEFLDAFSSDAEEDEYILEHYGKGHLDGGHSGRYPWGSGDNSYQRPEGGIYAEKFLSRYYELKDSGLDDKTIFRTMGFHGERIQNDDGSITEKDISAQYIRAMKSLATDTAKSNEMRRAVSLFERGIDPENPDVDNSRCIGNKSEIGRLMGKGDTSVALLLKPEQQHNRQIVFNVAEVLKKELANTESGVLEIGKGTEKDDKLGVSREKFEEALFLLKTQGYGTYDIAIKTGNKGKNINTKVLAHVDEQYRNPNNLAQEMKDMYREKVYKALNEGTIGFMGDFHSQDNGETFNKWHYPESLDSSRLQIRYAEDKLPDGSVGKDRDGLILVKPGVADVSLGDDLYSQVRIMVDGKSYLKGMAAYGDPKEFPPGIDVIFNTNKHRGTALHEEPGSGKESVLKPLKKNDDGTINRDNPFGAAIKPGAAGQRWYPEDADPSKQKLSLINKNKEEGDWADWKDKLPAQFLSKQPEPLVRAQLEKSINQKKDEYDEILSLTNPTIKKYYLEKFAQTCDTTAKHLEAIAIPGQKYQVFLPVPSLKDNEVYAPNWKDGTKVAIIRFPHAGTFEIPICTVTSGNKEARRLMGGDSETKRSATDAIGINPKTAARLSGADFDGDAGIVIPIGNGVNIKNSPALKELEGFEPAELYGTHQEGTKTRRHKNKETGEWETYEEPIIVSNVTGKPVSLMKKKSIQQQMGMVSNLITDMTIAEAPLEDVAKAVKHSMVVIDAYKHHYDYHQSEVDNDIQSLRAKYQVHYDLNGNLRVGGASTILSRAKNKVNVNERQGQGVIDRETGEVTYRESGRTYTKYGKGGKVLSEGNVAMTEITQMDYVKDARQLISPYNTPIEQRYADYANANKALANSARKEMVNTPTPRVDSNAKKVYANEVASLQVKINDIEKNKPRERKANAIVSSAIKNALDDNPALYEDKDAQKKLRQRLLDRAREEVGSTRRSDRYVPISDREWEAIQHHAISSNQLKIILDNSDPEELRRRALPSSKREVSDSVRAAILRDYNSGKYSNAVIAAKYNVSPTTVSSIGRGRS